MSRKMKHIYEPALGVKTDFETLLQKFASAGTVRYQKFAEFWRDMNMACYCAGRQTKREAREFVEQCFQIATQFWLPPSSFLVRSGALYLLYGLYYFQLVIPKVKIRITPEQWQTITEFQQEAREQQHLDLDFVFQKMVLDKAFHYVATQEEVYQIQRGSEDTKIIPENMKEETSMLDDIFSGSTLNQLSLVHEQYQKMKLALSGDNNSEPDSTLSIVHSDLVNSIYKTLQTHKERQAGLTKSHTTKDVNFENIEEQMQMYTPLETVSMQKHLKQKAFEQGTSGYRQRGRPRLSGKEKMENAGNEEPSKYDSTYGRRQIPGLYDKDETEDGPVQIPEVHELFCMPDLDTIGPKPLVKAGSTEEDSGSSCDDSTSTNETAEKREQKADKEEYQKSEMTDSEQHSNDNKVFSGKQTKRKQEEDNDEMSDPKKSKVDSGKSKTLTDSKEKPATNTAKQKPEEKSKGKASRISGKINERKESTMPEKLPELKSKQEESEENEKKGEKELTAMEKLQMKLLQRRKENRRKSQKVTKRKKKS